MVEVGVSKEQVVEALISKLEEGIYRLQERIKERRLVSSTVGDTVDVVQSELPFSEDDVSLLSSRLRRLQEEVAYLRELPRDRKEVVEEGSLVTVEVNGKEERFLILDGERFKNFVSLGEVSTLTTSAPVTRVLLGKKAGDVAVYSGTTYKILSVE